MRISFAIFICLFFTSVHAADRGSYPFDEFVTSYWYGPPSEFTTLERYQEIKDANFNLVFPGGNNTVEQNRQILDFCKKLGMKALIADTRMVTAIGKSGEARARLDAIVRDYHDCSALSGYFVLDEPGADQFPGLAEVVAYLKEKDPAHPGFINLFPTYADPATQLKTRNYQEHVDQFVQTVKPFVISYDNYSMIKGGDRGDFSQNLAIIRNASLKSHTPFWNIVLCVQHYDYRDLTEPELRYQAMQTLAFGGKGLLWYTYWYPGPPNPTVQHAMINHDGSRDKHYEMIKQINADARAIGNVLFDAESWATFQSGARPEFSAPKATPIEPAGAGELTIGVFNAAGGKTLALIANRDYKSVVKTQVHVNGQKVEQFDARRGTWQAAQWQQQNIALEIPAGDAVLLRW